MIGAPAPAVEASVARPGHVVAITAHARAVAAEDRARLAAALIAAAPPGAVIVATCHRVEAYVSGDDEAGAPGLGGSLPPGAQVLRDAEAVRHLVAVAAGRDSVVAGEDEILHQLRGALEMARRSGGVDPVVDRAFAVALRAGRQARSWLQGPRRSLGDVAVEAIGRDRGLVGRSILVVGAGKMGAIAARCAVRAGARVIVANRSHARARTLATAVGGTCADLDPGPAVVASAVGLIVALGAPWRIRDATADALLDGGAVVVDLSFPPAVSTTIAAGLDDRLVTADSLATGRAGAAGATAMANGASRERQEAATAERTGRLIERAVADFADWAARSDSRAAAQALIRQADAERERELEALWRRVPHLDPEARAAIEGMTRQLAERLLQAPLERLGRDRDGRDGRAVRELFAL